MTEERGQFDLLDNDTTLIGLAVEMPAHCPRCNSTAAAIGASRAPHPASLICACGRHCGWISPATFNFLRKTVRHFGRPTGPICVTANRRQAESSGVENRKTSP